ncbi:hypothetical protein ElyMa_003726500 [Elysia marginata]|uniref:Uncharacterized protein n=1 Tax=Elysia marginata TaxID=1093978 RepID=A0AAV4F635_9GAST|nr:hypothetical protein ElyMa_003726500 [Elysia marginata]
MYYFIGTSVGKTRLTTSSSTAYLITSTAPPVTPALWPSGSSHHNDDSSHGNEKDLRTMHASLGTSLPLTAWAPSMPHRYTDSYVPSHWDARRLPRSALDAISTAGPLSSAVENYASHILQNEHLHQDTDSFSSSLSPSSSSPSSSLLSSQPSSTSSPSSLFELTEMIRDFWSTFPCPPPWRPRLLAEVNATSRLEPSVGRQVHSFLAGKCRLHNVYGAATDLHPAGGLDLRGRGQGGGGFYIDLPGSGSVGDGVPGQSPSPHADHSSWCDSGCKVALGCAVLLAMLMVLVGILVYLTRNRRTSKMAAARPSRQQLQMSTSVSDTVNCVDFPNLEVTTVYAGSTYLCFTPYSANIEVIRPTLYTGPVA